MIGSIPHVSTNPAVQRRYEEMRRAGESHNIARMLATERAPMLVTDDTFMAGRRNGAQFADSPWLGEQLKAQAEAAGISTAGKCYIHGLASHPGDPRAWVSSRGEVLELARERNLNVSGLVEHKARPVEPTEIHGDHIADDILVREAGAFASTGMKPDEAMAAAWDLRTGRNNPHPLLVDDNVPHPEEILARDGDL